MKLTVEIGRDEELRKEILGLIRTEIRSISGEEIKIMVQQCMAEQNVAARVVAAFKDLINQEINLFTRGYGRKAAEDLIKNKFQEIVDKQFENFFIKHAMPFLQNYVKKNLESVSGTVNLIKTILGDQDGANKKDV